MPTFNNGESLSSVRTKINNAITSVDDKVIGRKYASVAKNTDTPNTLAISAGQVNTFVELPLTFDYSVLNGFTQVTNGIQYTGAMKKFHFNGVSTVGSSATNTVVHFRLAKNGTTITPSESSAKLDAATSLEGIAGALILELTTNDVLKIYVEADKACTISAYHTSLTLIEV